jgi:hypothetical protein
MVPAESRVKERPVTASYTIKLELEIDVHFDTTKGRKIEDFANDVMDYLGDNEEFWESFPSVIGMSTALTDAHLNPNG